MNVSIFDAFQALSESFPWMRPLYDGVATNKSKWQELSEMVALGLTWVNSDTIDQAIAENGK